MSIHLHISVSVQTIAAQIRVSRMNAYRLQEVFHRISVTVSSVIIIIEKSCAANMYDIGILLAGIFVCARLCFHGYLF